MLNLSGPYAKYTKSEERFFELLERAVDTLPEQQQAEFNDKFITYQHSIKNLTVEQFNSAENDLKVIGNEKVSKIEEELIEKFARKELTTIELTKYLLEIRKENEGMQSVSQRWDRLYDGTPF